MQKTSMDSKEASFEISKNRASALVRKEKSSTTIKARREASRNKFVVKDGMPDRVESFRKVDSSKNRPRAKLEFVKSIRNGLRKLKHLIESRPSTAESGMAGRENGIRFQKESTRDRMMRSKNFETQEVRDK